MSNYTKTVNFAAKDSLPSGDAAKIVKGTEIDTEFNNIATASATKADAAGAALTGTTTFETISDGTISITAFVDEDNMASNSATLLPTQQSVKAYVDASVFTGVADGSITTAKLADDAVTAAKLASNAVVTASIVDDNVTQAKIADDAVTAAKIADNAVDIARLNVSDGTAGQSLTTNGSGTLAFATIGGAYNDFVVKTGNYTAVSKDQLIVNSGSAVTITLPASPSAGDVVFIKNAGTSTVTVARNGSNINSTADDGELAADAGASLVYVDATIGWEELQMAITLGGGGSASQVNEVVILNNSANVVTLADGRVYLKAGVFEDDLSVYPDASTSKALVSTFSTAASAVDPTGITWDGTSFWVVGGTYGNKNVVEYNTAGVEQSSFDVSSTHNDPEDIVWDGSYLWVLGDGQNKVTKWSTGGVYQNVEFSVGGQETSAKALTWDGTHFWVIGYQNRKAFKYNSSGVYQNVSFSVSVRDSQPTGITWDGTYFWVTGVVSDAVHKYSSAGVYQGESFSTVPYTSPQGLTWDGSDFWMVDAGDDSGGKFGLANGIHEITSNQSANGVELGGTVYTRVK